MLDDEYYQKVVYPIMYNYIHDFDVFRRNAAVALGSSGDTGHLPALKQARELYDNPQVLKAIDWAIAKLENA